MKLRYNEARDEVTVTIPKDKAKITGWLQHLREHGAGTVEVDVSAAGEGTLRIEEIERNRNDGDDEDDE